MTFATGYLADPAQVAGGERYGTTNIIFGATTFEDGLKVGRFAKLDTGSIDNMDGSATPVIAGVVLRNVANATEDAGTIDSALYSNISYIRQGLVAVDVKAGETPAQFGRVYASNAGDASDGMATATNTDVDTNAEFVQEVKSGVWLIYVTPAPGDVSTHISDATGAHAASAISILDTAGLTASANVETLSVELLPAVARVAAIADPGDAGALPVIRSGNCAITTAGAETRTLAAPGTVGLTLALSADVVAGAATVTVASAINVTGNNTIVLDAAGETIILESVQVAGVPVWRVGANDGATLSTVA